MNSDTRELERLEIKVYSRLIPVIVVFVRKLTTMVVTFFIIYPA